MRIISTSEKRVNFEVEYFMDGWSQFIYFYALDAGFAYKRAENHKPVGAKDFAVTQIH